jgi:hypothetical protein
MLPASAKRCINAGQAGVAVRCALIVLAVLLGAPALAAETERWCSSDGSELIITLYKYNIPPNYAIRRPGEEDPQSAIVIARKVTIRSEESPDDA